MNKITIFFILIIFSYCMSYAGGLSTNEMGTTTVDYYHKLSVSETKSLIKKSNAIAKGDTYASVINKLGNPHVSKFIQGKNVNSPVTGRIFRYYIAKYDEDLVNELLDEYVMIVFDANDTVVDVTYKLSDSNQAQK